MYDDNIATKKYICILNWKGRLNVSRIYEL